jgi:Putative DNA-binding domain
MSLGSFTHGALAELSAEDLGRMLELDETLFVEHKGDIGEDKDALYGLVSAVAAFANTYGGWLLIGVTNRKPNGNAARWRDPQNAPTLVDAIRARLRGEIDPLPAFEAKLLEHADGPVAVVRVYESSDTPHVVLRSGAVFVREPAGTTDAADPKRPGGGSRGERAYRATQIRSRQQILELAQRGRRSNARVLGLLDPATSPPLVTNGLAIGHFTEQVRMQTTRGQIVVRMAPYTPTPRFRGWATTTEAAARVVAAGEDLSDMHGMTGEWVWPDPSGATLLASNPRDKRHTDATGVPLQTDTRIVLDAAGVVGAGFELLPPMEPGLVRRMQPDQIASEYICPVVRAVANLLTAAEFLGRSRCHIDLFYLWNAVRIEHQGERQPGGWVPTAADVALPAEEVDLEAVSLLAAYAYGRSAGLRFWDPPLGS